MGTLSRIHPGARSRGSVARSNDAVQKPEVFTHNAEMYKAGMRDGYRGCPFQRESIIIPRVFHSTLSVVFESDHTGLRSDVFGL